MPCINVKARRHPAQRGFTLVELMTAALISLIVFAALLALTFISRATLRVSPLPISNRSRALASSICSRTMWAPPPRSQRPATGNWSCYFQMQAKSLTLTRPPIRLFSAPRRQVRLSPSLELRLFLWRFPPLLILPIYSTITANPEPASFLLPAPTLHPTPLWWIWSTSGKLS